jgi:hypothetical protein
MKPAVLLFLTVTLAHAGVILNAPDPNSGFFDGMSDYFNFDGTGKIGNISSLQVPETNGLSTQKVYGTVSMEGGNYDPYIVMIAWGTASGSFATDSEVAVHFNFNISPNLPNGLPYYVQGELSTVDGYFYTEYVDATNWTTAGLTSSIASNFTYIIPAGLEVTGWRVSLGVGNYGAQTGLPGLTLTIPANSVELVALPYNNPTSTLPSDVPEPATLALTALGIALLIARRLRHPV